MASASFDVSPDSSRRTATPIRAPFQRKLVRPDAATQDDAVAVGTLDYAHVGDMRVGRFAAARACTTRHPLSLSNSAADHIFVAVQLKGQSVMQQNGRSMQLMPGNWGLCDAPKPCLSSHLEGVEQFHFLIPRSEIRIAVDTRFVIGRSFGGSSRVSALMCQTICSLVEELPALDPRRAEELADVALRLFHLAINERIEQPSPLSVQEDMRERIGRHVESRLRDPRLSLDQIAAGLNCTKRYLHMVFESEQYTLNEYIWVRRLEHCKRDLANPALRGRSITDIAMCWGFSNLSHFSRTFRERFGKSPREARSGGGTPFAELPLQSARD
jgi:AraC-like DNA-binding protein